MCIGRSVEKSKKKALLLGGSGAIGRYLTGELIKLGFSVAVTTRRSHQAETSNITYLLGNAQNDEFLAHILRNKYDVIIDFMTYSVDDFSRRVEILLQSTTHYIFLSSYRVFAESDIITEDSPRLLDSSDDSAYLKTGEYALEKARQEDILRNSNYKNWTIVRPAITYSYGRFQLGILEADTTVWRSLRNLSVPIPRSILDKKTTMTWAGDVARMISLLALNKKAFGDDFNVATAENSTWREVANIYEKNVGMRTIEVSDSDYLDAIGQRYAHYQLRYDRMFNRVLDNSKILKITGIKQSNLATLETGLAKELKDFSQSPEFSGIDHKKQRRFNKITKSNNYIDTLNTTEKKEYVRDVYPFVYETLKSAKGTARYIKGKTRVRTRLRNLKAKLSEIETNIRQKQNTNKELKEYRAHNEEFLKSDGAIVTLSGYFNYGNMMQRYALPRFLKLHGYNFVSYCKERPPIDENEARRFMYTQEFVERNIWRKEYDARDKFKAYITGSDQVWRNWEYNDVRHTLGFFYLDFTRNFKTRRMSYAASFGQDTLEDALVSNDFAHYIAPVLKSYNAVSVRERSAVQIMKSEWDIEATQVLDPTMLLDATDYEALIDNYPYALSETADVFSYFITNNEAKRAFAQAIRNSIDGSASIVDLSDTKTQLPPVECWLKSIRDASFFITDSFHGVVFAIQFGTPFVLMESGTGGVDRTKTLLNSLGLGERYVTSKEASKFKYEDLNDIDWTDVHNKLDKLRSSSAEWLLDSVKSSKPRKP